MSTQGIRKERLDGHTGHSSICRAGYSFIWQGEIEQEWQEEK